MILSGGLFTSKNFVLIFNLNLLLISGTFSLEILALSEEHLKEELVILNVYKFVALLCGRRSLEEHF